MDWIDIEQLICIPFTTKFNLNMFGSNRNIIYTNDVGNVLKVSRLQKQSYTDYVMKRFIPPDSVEDITSEYMLFIYNKIGREKGSVYVKYVFDNYANRLTEKDRILMNNIIGEAMSSST